MIDKTVQFVHKNGIGFESKVRESQRANKKFNFINAGHPFNTYYKWQLQVVSSAKARLIAEKFQKEKLQSNRDLLSGDSFANLKSIQNTTQPMIKVVKLTLAQRINQQLLLARKPKQEFISPLKSKRFAVPIPEYITAYELDIMKLCAQYTSIIGKSFVRDIIHSKSSSHMFSFLSPVNPRFQYFQRLVDSYRGVIHQFDNYKRKDYRMNDSSDDIMVKYKKENTNFDYLLNESIGHSEYSKLRKDKEIQYLEDEEQERIANALIDWQSFVVLEYIEFDDNEEYNMIAPGKTIQDIDRILECTMDVRADIHEPLLVHTIEDDDEDEMEMEMDTDESESDDDTHVVNKVIEVELEEEDTDVIRRQKNKLKAMLAANIQSSIPAPKGVITSYDLNIAPKLKLQTNVDVELRLQLEKLLNDSRTEQSVNQKCPICGEFIAVDHLTEHIRIELLDPKWKEQKESLKVKFSQTSLAGNQQISDNLNKFAAQHAQLFGGGSSKKDDKRKAMPPKPQWDGHKDTIATNKKLAAIHEQMQKQREKEALALRKANKVVEQFELQQAMVNNMQPMRSSMVTNVDVNKNVMLMNEMLSKKSVTFAPNVMSHSALQAQHSMNALNAMNAMKAMNAMNAMNTRNINPMAMNPLLMQQMQRNAAIAQMYGKHMPGVMGGGLVGMPGVPLMMHPPLMTNAMLAHGMLNPNVNNSQTPNVNRIQPPPPSGPPPSMSTNDAVFRPPLGKKMKLNDGTSAQTSVLTKATIAGLMTEQDFMDQHPVPEQIKVQVPNDPKKTQFKFKGQMLCFTMGMGETIGQLKERIKDKIGLAVNRQKLKISSNGMWVKDGSLAYWNIDSTSKLELSARTRGGRGKPKK